MTNQNDILVGGWSDFGPVTDEAKSVFHDALIETGVLNIYSPLVFATQLVAGVNFNFFCNVSHPNQIASPVAAFVSIFKPLGSKTSMVTGIQPYFPPLSVHCSSKE